MQKNATNYIANENIYEWVERVLERINNITYDELVFVGISFGAWMLILIAENIERCHCIFIGSAISLNIGMKKNNGIAYQYVFESSERFPINDILVNKKLLKSMIYYQPLLYIDRVKSIESALILCGENDNLNRKIDSLYLLMKFLENEVDAEVKQYEKGRYMLNNIEVSQMVFNDVKEWRKKHEIGGA